MIEALGDDAVLEATLRARLGHPWAAQRHARDELDRLLQLDTTFTEVSDGVVFVPALLEGTTWTVWIDPDDGAEGFVRTRPGLTAMGWWLIGDDVELVDASCERRGVLETDGWLLDGKDIDVVIGPDGWLDDLLGRWVSVEVVGGALRWSPLDEPPLPTPAQVTAMRVGFDRAVRHDAEFEHMLDATPPDPRFVYGDDPIHEALLADRRAFRDDPIPPLTDLYTAAGLVERDGAVAEDGFDWAGLRRWQTRMRLGMSYRLDASQADQAARLVAAYDAWAGADGEQATVAADGLDDGDVAAAVWSELHDRRDVSTEQLERFAATLRATDPSSIGTVWLRARLLERTGHAAAALDALETAVDARCRHEPALVDLAGLRADRGDAAGALRLLTQAGLGDDDEADDGGNDRHHHAELLWDEIVGFATHRPRPVARRNDPCPCGSGRKYKACHLGRETHSLDDRAGWVYLKAQRFLRNRQPEAVADLAELIVDEFDQRVLFDALLDGPFVPDVVLHEEGVFAEFLAARDRLLPDDEALLGAQWALVDRAVFELVEVHRTGLELRNVATGERISVVNAQASEWTRPGMLVVGRPLPVGDAYRAFCGFMRVPHGHAGAMMDAIDARDSEAIAAALAAILAPPRLTNTDGDDLVAHTITWRVPDPSAVGDALVTAGFQADDDGRWTLTRDTQNQDNTLIADVGLDADELTVEVNSAERADELQAIVASALPDAELVDVDPRPFEMPESPVRTAAGGPVDLDDPAIRAFMAEHIAAIEQRWLDESIPALGGRTPREAAGDPIGREELTQLLASFPVPTGDQIGAMNPDRLRAALGL